MDVTAHYHVSLNVCEREIADNAVFFVYHNEILNELKQKVLQNKLIA